MNKRFSEDTTKSIKMCWNKVFKFHKFFKPVLFNKFLCFVRDRACTTHCDTPGVSIHFIHVKSYILKKLHMKLLLHILRIYINNLFIILMQPSWCEARSLYFKANDSHVVYPFIDIQIWRLAVYRIRQVVVLDLDVIDEDRCRIRCFTITFTICEWNKRVLFRRYSYCYRFELFISWFFVLMCMNEAGSCVLF